LREQLKTLANERRRFGYRRLHILLRRAGVVVNHKKLFRLYREERLTVRRRGGRKRAIGTRAPMTLPQAGNQRWSLDFVSDTLSDGRRFRVLVIVDDFTRECLTLSVDTSIGWRRATRTGNRRRTARNRRRSWARATNPPQESLAGRRPPKALRRRRDGNWPRRALHPQT
jgi:transposase InsO family protein